MLLSFDIGVAHLGSLRKPAEFEYNGACFLDLTFNSLSISSLSVLIFNPL